MRVDTPSASPPASPGMTFAVTEHAALALDKVWDTSPHITALTSLLSLPRPVVVLATREDAPLLAAITEASDVVTIAVVRCEHLPADMPLTDDVVFNSATPEEIVYRAERALRRRRKHQIELDEGGLHAGSTHVSLSVAEHRLLASLLQQRGVPRSRAELRAALGVGHDEGRALDAHIYRLRRKLSVVPSLRLETLRQRGFRLIVDEDGPRRREPRAVERSSA